MEIKPVAVFHSPVKEKFGLPRQAGLAESLSGWIELEEEFRREEAVRGLDGFDYLWLIWGFHLNRKEADEKTGASERLTVRPPRLGGNTRVGVFASRSPFRPNGMGLSSVRIERIEGCRIYVLGADLADGTPIYDIKPYVEYSDSHTGVRSGFVDSKAWQSLELEWECSHESLSETEFKALCEILSQDPRPQYHDDPSKVYGLGFAGLNVRFSVCGNILRVISIDGNCRK